MTPAIAHDHKYFFFSLVTAYDLYATRVSFHRLINGLTAYLAPSTDMERMPHD